MMRKFWRADAGASLAEFAILAPVLAFLLIGLIEVGRYTFFAILAANAARAGTTYGAYNLSNASNSTGMKTAALNDGQNLSGWSVPTATIYCQQGGSAVTCPVAPATPAPGEIYYVKVVVTGQYSSLMSYPGIPHQVNVSGTSVMRVAQQ